MACPLSQQTVKWFVYLFILVGTGMNEKEQDFGQ